MLEGLEVGHNIYCPQEGWSGVVQSIECDEDGVPGVAIILDHDPRAERPFICLPLDCYRRDETGHLHS